MTNDGSLTNGRRKFLIAGALSVSAAGLGGVAGAPAAAETPPAPDPNALYFRLGGIFSIAAVIDYFSDAVVKNPVAGAQSKNPALREWHTKNLGRLPGLKFMRTLWVADISGGPYKFVPTMPGSTDLGMEAAHKGLKISPEEFDAVAGELSNTLDHFKVPDQEKGEVLAAFAAHKDEVTKGYRDAN